MAYIKTEWKARQGTGLNRFKKSGETEEFIYLDNEPDQINEPGTSFSTERMNNIENGIFNAHNELENEVIKRTTIGKPNGTAGLDADGKVPLSQLPEAVAGNLDSVLQALKAKYTKPSTGIPFSDLNNEIQVKINSKSNMASMVEGAGRDLMKVLLGHGIEEMTTQPLRNEAIAEVTAELRRRCNNNGEIDNTGVPDFDVIRIGDYIDGFDLSGIAAAPGGTAPQAWNDTYKNNRILVSGFNTYKNAGDTENVKNHILFTFRNVICQGQMNGAHANANGYAATLMRTWLEGADGAGDGVFALGLKSALGGDYLYTIRKYHSKKNPTGRTWNNYTVWPPTEIEVHGSQMLGDEAGAYPTADVHFPIYHDSIVYRVKRFNGSRYSWRESTPYASDSLAFCLVDEMGCASQTGAAWVLGVSPAFCVA
jgi:hypothetical protein